jgi:hypothetical protein
MKAALSILALYNYDNSIFDIMVLPVGVVKDDVINNLLMELAEFEIIYASPVMIKSAIEFWSKKELPVWTKIYATTALSYEPLENLYRTENYTDDETRNLSGSNNQTRNVTETLTRSGTDTVKEYVSGFNETNSTLAKQRDDAAGIGSENSDTGTINNAMTDTGTIKNTRTADMHGSIGVITPQQMIKQEREVSEFNMCNYIIDSFKRRFCLLIY